MDPIVVIAKEYAHICTVPTHVEIHACCTCVLPFYMLYII